MFRFAWTYAWQTMRRNAVMTSVAIGTTAVLLLALSTLVVLVAGITSGVQAVQSRVSVIGYIKDGSSTAAVQALKAELLSRPEVASVTYVSKAQALQDLEHQFAQHADLIAAIRDNPLPASLNILLRDPNGAQQIGELLRSQPTISDVTVNQNVIDRLLAAGRFIRIAGLAMVVGLTIAVIFVMTNVSRLAIYTRQAEIEVMRLVGASDWFVRWPFVLEGALCGGIASLAAFFFVALGYHSLIQALQGSFAFLQLQLDPLLLPKLFGGGLIIGTGIGVLGSGIAVRRFWEPAQL
ncbi:MAG: ABC transporter permease [Chloroflexi bacterium]|nr:ABC transporter permease [Chloroflexota bacterium]